MSHHSGLSRRRIFRTAAAAPLATAAVIGSGSALALSNPRARVAATIVRIGQSRASTGGVRVGLRLSVMGPTEREEEMVIVVDPVDFNVSGDELRRQLVSGTQDRVRSLLALRGVEMETTDIAVHIFGGPL